MLILSIKIDWGDDNKGTSFEERRAFQSLTAAEQECVIFDRTETIRSWDKRYSAQQVTSVGREIKKYRVRRVEDDQSTSTTIDTNPVHVANDDDNEDEELFGDDDDDTDDDDDNMDSTVYLFTTSATFDTQTVVTLWYVFLNLFCVMTSLRFCDLCVWVCVILGQ